MARNRVLVLAERSGDRVGGGNRIDRLPLGRGGAMAGLPERGMMAEWSGNANASERRSSA